LANKGVATIRLPNQDEGQQVAYPVIHLNDHPEQRMGDREFDAIREDMGQRFGVKGRCPRRRSPMDGEAYDLDEVILLPPPVPASREDDEDIKPS
jgi:hypothetical protein